MRVSSSVTPFNPRRFSTPWIDRTGGRALEFPRLESLTSAALLVLAAAATLTTWVHSPILSWAYTIGIFLLAGTWMAREVFIPSAVRIALPGAALAMISVWGFVQLGLNATVYRYATLDASIRTAALGATALVASRALHSSRLRLRFLKLFAAFGFLVSVVAVLANCTSPGRVLWMFPSPYPDTWGPFLSRNDFAGFLELSFPVALWLGLSARSAAWLWAPAWMLAAGVASASRAGVVCLALETLVILAITRRAKAARFLAAAAVLIAIAGAGTLLGRLADSDPLLYRREIAGSALEMIRAHPWRGFGIGTFPQVYPAFATFDAGALVEHAHNEWLEWAAGGGLPYAAVWAAFAAALFVPALRSVWGVGIIAAFVHATVDYPFARFGLTAWTFSLAGALCGDRNRALRELGQRGH